MLLMEGAGYRGTTGERVRWELSGRVEEAMEAGMGSEVAQSSKQEKGIK